MTGNRRRLRARSAVPASLLCLPLLACGPGSSDPQPAPSPGGTGSASSTGSPTEPETGESTESPSVEPAAGIELKQRSFTLHAPEGWVKGDGGAFSRRAVNDKLISTITVVQIPGAASSVDEAFRREVKSYPEGVERLPDTTLGGVPVYHFSASDSAFREEVLGGTINQGDSFTVELQFAKMRVNAKEAQGMIDSVLASFEPR